MGADGHGFITLRTDGNGGDADDINIQSRSAAGNAGDINITADSLAALGVAGDINIIADDPTHTGGNFTLTVGQLATIIADKDIEIQSSAGSVFLDANGGQATMYGSQGFNVAGEDAFASIIEGMNGGLTIQSTGGILTLSDLANTPGAIAPPANFSGTLTINGVEVPYY
jgi:hypothetical protein